MRGHTLMCVVVAFGCANAGSPRLGDDEPKDALIHNDVPVPTDTPTPIDGPAIDAPLIDAPIPVDAAVDAPTGPFCMGNTMCAAGTCCLIAVCVPGTAVGVNFCFPK